jgi:hypothetical protein
MYTLCSSSQFDSTCLPREAQDCSKWLAVLNFSAYTERAPDTPRTPQFVPPGTEI